MGKLSGFLALVTLGVSAAPGSAQTAWETVTSKEGQFTVEMPTKPDIERTRTRKAPGGTVKVTAIGCKAESGVYLVYRIDLPTAIVKGTEDAELDAARNDLAEEWN